jgi:hypothetical protein
MNKNIAVVVAGSNQIHDLQIQPATTAGDVLEHVGMAGGMLTLGGNSNPIDSNENVYGMVQNGQKLFASVTPEVGIMC